MTTARLFRASRRSLRGPLAALTLGVAASAAGAQFDFGTGTDDATEEARSLQPPAVGDLGSPGVIVTYGIGGALALVAFGLAILPSRRTHQD